MLTFSGHQSHWHRRNILLKTCAAKLSPIFWRLFCSSYRTDIFPLIWKSVNIQPVPTEGRTNIVTNYRPISLVSNLSKCINQQIVHIYVGTLIWISTQQNNWRLVDLHYPLLELCNSFGVSEVIVLDIFDRVWYELRLVKQQAYSLCPEFCLFFICHSIDKEIRKGITSGWARGKGKQVRYYITLFPSPDYRNCFQRLLIFFTSSDVAIVSFQIVTYILSAK